MSKVWKLIFFVIVGCVLYYLQDQWLIRNNDDYGFTIVQEMLVNEDGEQYMAHSHPVNSFVDALKSQAVCYVLYNGRFLVHAITQWLCGTKSDGFIVLCNTLAWALLLICFMKLAFGKDRMTLCNMTLAFCVIWLLMPNAFRVFTGAVSANVNYLWSGAANLFILLIFNKIKNRNDALPVGWTIVVAVLALLVGSMQESFSIGIAAGLSLYALWNFKRLPVALWVMIACYLVGTAFCVFAPSNFLRADLEGYAFRWYAIIDLFKAPVFPLSVLLLIGSAVIYPDIVRKVLKENVVLVIAIVVNLLFAIFIAYTMPWQLTCTLLLTSILMLQVFSRLPLNKIVKYIIVGIAVCGFLVLYSAQYQYRHELWKVNKSMLDEASATKDGLVSLGDAFEVDKRLDAKSLAPFYRIYLRNPLVSYIYDDQGMVARMMSMYLTHGKTEELVKAILPEKPEKIEQLIDTEGTSRENGGKSIQMYSYTIFRSSDEQQQLVDGVEPRQSWSYKSNHYKLYAGHIGQSM